MNNYLTQVKYPVWNETIKQSLSKEIYEQYQSLSADTVQDPKFYDAYKKALDESDMRTEAVLNTIQAVLGNLTTIGEFSTGVIGVSNLSSSLFGIWCIIPGIREQSLYIENLRTFSRAYIARQRKAFSLTKHRSKNWMQNHFGAALQPSCKSRCIIHSQSQRTSC